MPETRIRPDMTGEMQCRGRGQVLSEDNAVAVPLRFFSSRRNQFSCDQLVGTNCRAAVNAAALGIEVPKDNTCVLLSGKFEGAFEIYVPELVERTTVYGRLLVDRDEQNVLISPFKAPGHKPIHLHEDEGIILDLTMERFGKVVSSKTLYRVCYPEKDHVPEHFISTVDSTVSRLSAALGEPRGLRSQQRLLVPSHGGYVMLDPSTTRR